MGGFSVQISGLAELDANLEKLKKPTLAIRKALRAGGEVFQREIQMRAPERTDDYTDRSTALPPGALRNDIIITASKDDDGNLAVDIGPGKYTAHVANFVEYGHRLVRGGYSKVNKKTGKTRGTGSQVGDVKEHPFIRPAYEAGTEEATDAACIVLAEAIENGQVS